MQCDDTMLSRLRDPATPAEELAAAWRECGCEFPRSLSEVKAGMSIASNPNAPIAILNKAAQYYPMQVVQNPILSLLAVEDPTLHGFQRNPLIRLLAVSEALNLPIQQLLRSVIEALFKEEAFNYPPLFSVSFPLTASARQFSATLQKAIADQQKQQAESGYFR